MTARTTDGIGRSTRGCARRETRNLRTIIEFKDWIWRHHISFNGVLVVLRSLAQSLESVKQSFNSRLIRTNQDDNVFLINQHRVQNFDSEGLGLAYSTA